MWGMIAKITLVPGMRDEMIAILKESAADMQGVSELGYTRQRHWELNFGRTREAARQAGLTGPDAARQGAGAGASTRRARRDCLPHEYPA